MVSWVRMDIEMFKGRLLWRLMLLVGLAGDDGALTSCVVRNQLTWMPQGIQTIRVPKEGCPLFSHVCTIFHEG